MVVSPESASPHPYPLRSRSRGPYLRDLVEEVDEPTFYVSPHARRSLAVQEAWKKVRDEKKRKRREDEEAELDDGAGAGDDGPGSRERRGGGDDEEGPGGMVGWLCRSCMGVDLTRACLTALPRSFLLLFY